MSITREIQRVTVYLELEGVGQLAFSTEPVKISLHGLTSDEIEKKTAAIRDKIHKNLDVMFPIYTDKVATDGLK